MWQGKCVVLALGGCGVRTGRETRRGGQWRCWGCVRISGFFLGTVVLHVRWQTLNQDQVGIVGVPRGKCYQGSSFGWWDGLVSSHVSSLEMKHICKTQEIENKSLRDSELGVDGSVELQLRRHKNSWGGMTWVANTQLKNRHLFRSWWKFPEETVEWSWLWEVRSVSSKLWEWERRSESSRKKH